MFTRRTKRVINYRIIIMQKHSVLNHGRMNNNTVLSIFRTTTNIYIPSFHKESRARVSESLFVQIPQKMMPPINLLSCCEKFKDSFGHFSNEYCALILTKQLFLECSSTMKTGSREIAKLIFATSCFNFDKDNQI